MSQTMVSSRDVIDFVAEKMVKSRYQYKGEDTNMVQCPTCGSASFTVFIEAGNRLVIRCYGEEAECKDNPCVKDPSDIVQIHTRF